MRFEKLSPACSRTRKNKDWYVEPHRAVEVCRLSLSTSTSRTTKQPELRFRALLSGYHRPYPAIGKSRGNKACPQSDDHENYPKY